MKKNRWIKPLIFILSLLPFLILLGDAAFDSLGANPIEAITHRTGDWALRFLFITLSVTPLRRFSGWRWPGPLRRMLGLYAFFYACLHFSTWLILDQFFDLPAIIEDIIKRPYITVGMTALALLIPLAVTSTNKMVKRLGGARWKKLHKLVYVIAVLGVLHFIWLVKADLIEPGIYALILIILLATRIQRREPGRRV